MKVSRISVVGGGIGGLSAALALQHFGYRVSVFEQTRELREIGAGVVITPNAMHALNFLGVGERISKQAGPTEAYLIRHFQTGEVIKIRANGTDYVGRFGATYHQVHRADLHAALADALVRNDPNCVFLDHCFEALTQGSDHVVATFTNGKTYASDVLIGCDGGASKVRACVFGDEVVNYTGQVAFRALLPMSKVPPGVTKIPYAMFVGLNRALLHYPLRHRTVMNVIGMAREPSWQAHLGNQTNGTSVRSRKRSFLSFVRGCLLGTASSICCIATRSWSNSGSDLGMKLINPASKRPDLTASNCSKLGAG